MDTDDSYVEPFKTADLIAAIENLRPISKQPAAIKKAKEEYPAKLEQLEKYWE